MSAKRINVLEASAVESDTLYTLRQVCRSTGVHAEEIVEMVEVGLLEPRGHGPDEWRFPPYTLVRVHSALRLRRDLEVNLPGAALALELMEEVRRLRERLAALEREQPR